MSFFGNTRAWVRSRALSVAVLVGALGLSVFVPDVQVAGAAATAPSTVALVTSPKDGQTISGVWNITGSADIPNVPYPQNFQFYKVEWGAGLSPSQWNAVSSAYPNPVRNGTLDVWDTAKVSNGPYVIQLSVVDNTGQYAVSTVQVNVANGAPLPAASGAGTAAAPVGAKIPVSTALLSHRSYFDGTLYHIVGEVKNTGAGNIQLVKVVANFYDSSGQSLGSNYAFTTLNLLTSNQRSPFDMTSLPVANLARYDLSISAEQTPTQPAPVSLNGVNQYIDTFGVNHVIGNVHSNASTVVQRVQVAVWWYDVAGKLVNSGYTFPADAYTMQPGQTTQFDFIVPPSENAVAVSYQAQAQVVALGQ